MEQIGFRAPRRPATRVGRLTTSATATRSPPATSPTSQLVVDLLQHTQRLLTSSRRKLHEEPRKRGLLRDEARIRRQRRLLREALLLLITAKTDVAIPEVADLDSRRAG